MAKLNLFKKSINVLKSLQLKNGGILATPLNGAYPYIYIRDAVIMTKALNHVGLTKNSERFYRFVNKFSKPNQYKEIFQRYHKDGWPSISRKDQHDNVGLLLHGIYDTYSHTKNQKFLKEMWHLVKKSVGFIFDYSRSGLVKTGTSIHELYRLEHGYELWANCACCRGLYDASEIAKILGFKKEGNEWRNRAEKIHKNIKKKMFNKKTGLYMKNLKFPNITDITQIAPFYFGLENSKKVLKKTLTHLTKVLCHNEGGIRRFKKFEVTKDWHWYTGGSGGWVPYTPWIAKLYKNLGNIKKYNSYKKWIEKIAEMSQGFLPEHIATKKEYDEWKAHEIEFNSRVLKGMKKTEELYKKTKRKFKTDIVYWAIPLGMSHAEYILMDKNQE